MLEVQNVSLQFSSKKLFEDVTIKFIPGNTYGLIGANGAGKTTFLKILSGECEPTTGNVVLEPGRRISYLKQDQFAYDDEKVIDVVIQGNKKLYEIILEKNAIYAKPDFSDADGIKVGELEAQFTDMNGWEAESNAAILLEGLGVSSTKHQNKMSTLSAQEKVKVLLAQALFDTPDVLLLDEPTNNLDDNAKKWLENFLIDFNNTIITVSHDRHFLNKVCTHMADVDREKIQLYTGNYDFWKQSSELALELQNNSNKKKEEKIKELESFVARFSANASKSKQATSRKKQLEKISLDEIKPSSRQYPYINFEFNKKLGNEVLRVMNLTYEEDDKVFFKNLTFTIMPNEKVIFDSKNDLAITNLLKILIGELNPTSGTFEWGQTIEKTYMPKDIMGHFNIEEDNMVEWLRKYSPNPDEKDDTFIRGFLGRMLFSGDEPLKKVNKCSGGEKMRLMFSKMMLEKGNTLIMDDPTNHLDLESISSLNKALINFEGVILLKTHDLELKNTVCNKVIQI